MRLLPSSVFCLRLRTSLMLVALLVLLSLLRCQHSPLFVTSQSSPSSWLFLWRRTRALRGGKGMCSSQKSGGEGESCHLAKPSGALYVSDLHVSTCSKYNPLAFVDERGELWLPEGETGERERRGKRDFSWKCLHLSLIRTERLQRPIHGSDILNIFQKAILLIALFCGHRQNLSDSLLCFYLACVTTGMFMQHPDILYEARSLNDSHSSIRNLAVNNA